MRSTCYKTVWIAIILTFSTVSGILSFPPATPGVHGQSDTGSTIVHPWTDAISGGVWARMNNMEGNYSILDASQASTKLGSLVPSISQPQYAQSIFTNNFRVTGNNSLFPQEDEPSIAVRNQTGQFLMVVGANSLSSSQMVSYVSSDQGKHWAGPTYLPLSRGNDSFASDPALGVDRSGIFYYAFLSIGSTFFFGPSRGLDDVVVATSADGAHWTNHVAVPRKSSSGNFTSRSELFDKPYMAVGPSKSNPSVDEVYVTYTDFVSYCASYYFACGQNSTIMQVHSTDGGVTWSQPAAVSPSNFIPNTAMTGRLVQGSMPSVAQDGDVYVAYYDSGKDGWLNASARIMIAKSTDGGISFASPTQAALIPQQVTYGSEGNYCCFRWWSTMFPSMDVAPDGTVYIAYGARQAKYSQDPADVFLVASTDSGTTWSQPRKINDDSGQNGQFFAWVKVSQDGVVHIIWGDQRLDPVGLGYDVFYAEAMDHGATISPNSRVTDAGTDPLNTIGFIGDYFNMATSGNQVYPVWTDGRRGVRTLGREFLFGETDIFTAKIGPRDTPIISLGSGAPSGYLTPVAVSGSGLPRDAYFTMKMGGARLVSQQSGIVLFFSTTNGSLSDIILPSSNYHGSYQVELDDWLSGAAVASASFIIAGPPDFVLATSPSTLVITEGSTAKFTITAAGANGFSGTVTLTQSTFPPGLSCSFSTPSITSSVSSSSTLSCAGSLGIYIVTITGYSGNTSHSTTLTMQVNPVSSAILGISTPLFYGGVGGVAAVLVAATVAISISLHRRSRKVSEAPSHTTPTPPAPSPVQTPEQSPQLEPAGAPPSSNEI